MNTFEIGDKCWYVNVNTILYRFCPNYPVIATIVDKDSYGYSISRYKDRFYDEIDIPLCCLFKTREEAIVGYRNSMIELRNIFQKDVDIMDKRINEIKD